MALFASGLLYVEDFPDIAAQWLADGMDSENLRILAGANDDDPDDVRDLWTATLQDLHVQPIPRKNQWPQIWAYELASWKSGDRTSQQVLNDAVAYFRTHDYDDREAKEAWELWLLWDELTSTYDPPRTDAEIWADVEQYLSAATTD
jgi:hypothetical protein